MTRLEQLERWWDNGGDLKSLRFVRIWSTFWLAVMLTLATFFAFDQRWGWTAYYALCSTVHASHVRWALRATAERVAS